MAGFTKIKGPLDENAVDTETIDQQTYLKGMTRPDTNYQTAEEALLLQRRILLELQRINFQLALITGDSNGIND